MQSLAVIQKKLSLVHRSSKLLDVRHVGCADGVLVNSTLFMVSKLYNNRHISGVPL